MRKILLLFVMGMVLFQGCDKFLDIQPKGFTIPTKYEDYWRLMNYSSIYKILDRNPLFLTDDVVLGNEGEENDFISQSDAVKNLYSFAHGDIYSDGVSDPIWEGTYKRLYTLNAVINNVLDSEDATQAEKRMLRAEAMVTRAFEYLCLITCYAPAYDKVTASTDYGLPWVNSEDVNDIDYDRSSVEEIYANIRKDLDEAGPFLLDYCPNTFRPAKNVANGLLARMYLLQGEYSEALKYAKKSLEVNEKLVNLTEYMAKEGLSIGRIVRIDAPDDTYPEGVNNPENIFVRYLPSVFSIQGMFASKELMAVYDKDLPVGAVDKRRELWYADDEFEGTAFKGYTMFVPYIRANLALNNMEIILTAAECYAREGGAANLKEASRLYNLLRNNRIEGNVEVNFTDAEVALEKILEERRREFAFLGIYRFMDLKRLNKEPRFAKTLTHTVDGNTWTLPPNDNRYIFPIPPKVKSLRPDLLDYER